MSRSSRRFAAAYAEGPYGENVRQLRELGELGNLLLVEQGPGLFFTPGTDDLVIGAVQGPPLLASLEFGDGAFAYDSAREPVFASPPQTPSSVGVDRDHVAILLATPWPRLSAALRSAGAPVPDLDPLRRGGLARQDLAAAMSDLFVEGPPAGADALWQDEFFLMLGQALTPPQDSRREPRLQGGLAPHRIRRAKAYMLERLEDPPPLADVAAEVGMSPYHFWRSFRSVAGTPPHKWLLQQRLVLARQLLANPRLSLRTIAQRIGYGSVDAFAAVFVRHFGVTPTRFRKLLAR
jgi:AraC family transcriptional regulator